MRRIILFVSILLPLFFSALNLFRISEYSGRIEKDLAWQSYTLPRLHAEAQLAILQNDVAILNRNFQNQINGLSGSVNEAHKRARIAEDDLGRSKTLATQLENKIKELSARTSRVVSQLDTTAMDSVRTTIPAVVKLFCLQNNETLATGSGSISDSTGTVVTTAHVVGDAKVCKVAITQDNKKDATLTYNAGPQTVDQDKDLAVLKITGLIDGTDMPILKLPIVPKMCLHTEVQIGDKMFVVGYPKIGGDTISVTEGIIAGFVMGHIKTSAKIEHGNSGGLAMHQSGCSLGIPTSVVVGELESFGYVIDLTI